MGQKDFSSQAERIEAALARIERATERLAERTQSDATLRKEASAVLAELDRLIERAP